MEFSLSKSIRRSVKRRGYTRVSDDETNREYKNMKVVKFGGNSKRGWKIRVAKKLKLKNLSPLKLWKKIKTRYVNMMLNLGNGGGSVFGQKRIPQARQLQITYAPTEFENRLVLEIYKSLVASRELSTKLNPLLWDKK
ncbi:hypothetical protein POM88_050737 [Heracleum sosnowskyi]|uniref:Uncharacterized protein n=1 Tax=Heracleum sosnowskyi TaxID=360622 RepID=A0AAD8M1T2_9APIA|nr:hypothetical protein POM88_050737 [Heracleum sosnowskyi]